MDFLRHDNKKESLSGRRWNTVFDKVFCRKNVYTFGN